MQVLFKSSVNLSMKKKTQLQDFGYGTKLKKGLVLRGDVSYDNGAKYSGALKSVKKQIPHGYDYIFFLNMDT